MCPRVLGGPVGLLSRSVARCAFIASEYLFLHVRLKGEGCFFEVLLDGLWRWCAPRAQRWCAPRARFGSGHGLIVLRVALPLVGVGV